jgi:hypothetical protein
MAQNQDLRFIVSTPEKKACRKQEWTFPQLGLLLKCKIWKYTNLQCAQVLEHYFHSRTEGKAERVAPYARSLGQELGLIEQLHDDPFAIWVQRHKVPFAEVAEINSNWANWITLKTHEGALLRLLQGFDLQIFLQAKESYHAAIHLRELIPNQRILPTQLISNQPISPALEPLLDIEARICEASSRFKKCNPALRSDVGLWKEGAIEHWIQAWKVEKAVAQILRL